jgi:hypothetical protein
LSRNYTKERIVIPSCCAKASQDLIQTVPQSLFVIPGDLLFPRSFLRENANQPGIPFGFFCAKKINGIPDQIAFARKSKSNLSGMTNLSLITAHMS